MITNKSEYLNEYDIIQNSVLGAHCIHSALVHFEERRNVTQGNLGMMLPISYLILPIVFSNEFSTKASKMKFKINSFRSSIYDSGLTYHNVLQNATSLFNTTSTALNIAVRSGLLELRNTDARIYVVKTRELSSSSTKKLDYGATVFASRRLGAWFGQLTDSDILSLFSN